MAVYVDDAKLPFRRMLMSHMTADGTDELLGMANRIGVARKWLQCAGEYREHFDVCQTKRAEAIAAGAREITQRELGAMLMRKREAAEAAEGAMR